MEEKSYNDEENTDFLNESVKIALCLPTKVEYRGSTTREKLSQVFRKLAKRVILRDGDSLLDIAVAHSPVLCKALKLTKSRTTRLQEPTTIETTPHTVRTRRNIHSEDVSPKTVTRPINVALVMVQWRIKDSC